MASRPLASNDVAITHKLESICNSLHLPDTLCATFQALATEHLSTARHERDELEYAVALFLTTYGPALWPANKNTRHHLLAVRRKATPHWAQKNGALGPVFVTDSCLTGQGLRPWRLAHGSREPTQEEAIAGSRLGQVIQKYFEALLALEVTKGYGALRPDQLTERMVGVGEAANALEVAEEESAAEGAEGPAAAELVMESVVGRWWRPAQAQRVISTLRRLDGGEECPGRAMKV